MVEIFLVVLVARHTAEFGNHLFALSAAFGHRFGLADAGIEGQLEGRTHADALSVGFVGGFPVAELLVDLPKEELHAGTLKFSLGIACRALQIGKGIGEALLAEQEVGLGGIGAARCLFANGVATHFLKGVFSIVEPSGLRVATGKPLTGFCHHIGFGGVEASDVGEGGGRFEKFALFELCFTHQQPRVLEEGVEFLTRKVGFHLGCALFVATHHGAFLDGVELDGFLAFGDGRLVVALARGARLFVSHEEDGKHFRIVVLVSVGFCLFSFKESLVAVEVGVVACRERLPPTRAGRVLLRGARG